MLKRVGLLFFVITLLLGLFLPEATFAIANIYYACPYGLLDSAGKCTGTEAPVCYEGFVPCGLGQPIWQTTEENGKCKDKADLVKGKDEEGNEFIGMSCQLCHFFVMLDGIMDFVFLYVVPPIALLFIVIGGVLFYFGGAKPELLNKGKSLIKGVAIGLFLVYASFMLVSIFLTILGAAEWTGLADWAESGFFSVNCPIELPSPPSTP